MFLNTSYLRVISATDDSQPRRPIVITALPGVSFVLQSYYTLFHCVHVCFDAKTRVLASKQNRQDLQYCPLLELPVVRVLCVAYSQLSC